ncbi:MAG: uroporphyrinogen decarboxylase family protein [Verrucomicrobiae bacterium]|nr:uroporphyrinogen decarboxylase family protein [Verrucomicrobiae bacterium]
MNQRGLFFARMEGSAVDRQPFFPDISDWYKARRTPPGEPQKFNTGELIPDGIDFHKVCLDMPAEWQSWSYLDFYRNFNWGLPVHIYDWLISKPQGYRLDYKEDADGREWVWDTPRGKLVKKQKMAADGSFVTVKHPVETPEDFNALEFAATHTEFAADFDRVNDVLSKIGGLGVADLVICRSPFGKLVQEYAGFEQTVFWLADDPQMVRDYLAFQEEIDLKVIRLAAQTAARLVIISDHADEQLISPRWYSEYCMPFYRKACDILHRNGKFVSTHLDGNIRGFFSLLKDTGFDLMDGCTPAPMTNYRPEELGKALGPKQCAFCGVPSTLFAQNTRDEEILESARTICRGLGDKVILNVGDVLPANGNIRQVIQVGKWCGEEG